MLNLKKGTRSKVCEAPTMEFLSYSPEEMTISLGNTTILIQAKCSKSIEKNRAKGASIGMYCTCR
jgi:hypothetical protein